MNTDELEAVLPSGSGSEENVASAANAAKDDSSQPSAFYLVIGLFKVARGWHDRGDLGAAEQIYSFILRIRDRNPRLKCPEFPQTLANLAAVRIAEGRYMEAEHLYLQSLTSCAETIGEQNEICAEIMRDYAALLRRLKMCHEAGALEKRADSAYHRALPVTI